MHSCTAFAAEKEATPDGNPIIGVTKMITAEKVNSVVLVAFPEEGNSFVSNPMAGSVSENSGLNSTGFSWVFTAQWGEPIWGVANEVSFHYLDQYCGSPQDAVDFLEGIPRAGVTGAFLLTAKDGGIMGYESLSNVSAERVPGDAGETGTFMAQTNHLVNPKLQEYNIPGGVPGSDDRYHHAGQAAGGRCLRWHNPCHCQGRVHVRRLDERHDRPVDLQRPRQPQRQRQHREPSPVDFSSPRT